MLSPKKVKYRKQQKGRMRGLAYRGSSLTFGEYGLQATECARLTAQQIEAARIAMTRHVKRGGKIWIRVFPDKPFTKKPAETRMGAGTLSRRWKHYRQANMSWWRNRSPMTSMKPFL